MGMGHWACRACTTSWESIQTLCPIEADLFNNLLTKAGLSVDTALRLLSEDDTMNALVYSGVDENAEYFKGLQGNDLDSQIKLFSEDLVQAWDMLTYAFETATSVEGRGLRLLPCYHESESRYDDVDGGFFMVENADQMSPAGKAFLAHIRHSGWVCYG